MKTVTYGFLKKNHCMYIGESQKYEYWEGAHRKKYKTKRAYAEERRKRQNIFRRFNEYSFVPEYRCW